jgi:hypothetical protein
MDGIITVFLVADPGTAQPGIVELLLDADLIVQLVLLTLLGMSVVCWYIIFDKARMLRRASEQSAEFLKLFWDSRRLDQVYEKANLYPDSPIAEMFKAAYVELHKLTSGTEASPRGAAPTASADATDNLTRSLRRAGTVELTRLERMVPFLATTGSTGPFIGLFGTVWGICAPSSASAPRAAPPFRPSAPTSPTRSSPRRSASRRPSPRSWPTTTSTAASACSTTRWTTSRRTSSTSSSATFAGAERGPLWA